MRNLILAILITLFSSLSLGAETPRIFVMMDIDNIIIDTISPMMLKSTSYIDTLKNSGFSIQNIQINTKHSKDKKLDAFLKQTKQKPIELNDSNREKLNETIVIRPLIKPFLEELIRSEIPTYILICSKSNNERTQSIIASLNLEINKLPFKDAVYFVPKEFFTVQIQPLNINNVNRVSAKSAFELRNRYSGKFGSILPSDYVFLVDKIPDSQFILYDREHDLNIKISPFAVKNVNNYNIDYDQLELRKALNKIKEFVNKS